MESIKKGRINTIPIYLRYFQKNQSIRVKGIDKGEGPKIVNSQAYAEKLNRMYKLYNSIKIG
jgi:myosin-crossreactive antigen